MTTTSQHLGLLLLRLGFSGMMLTHGFPKLMKLFQGDLSFGDPIGIGAPATLILAVIAEVLCPVLIIIGFKTRWAAFPVVITMAVAVFVAHTADPFGAKEMGLLYLFGFLAIALLGAGKYSVDRE